MEPDPLLYLLRLKARGWLRAVKRRLSTWSGMLFALVGVLVASLWIGSLVLRARFAATIDLDPELLRPAASLFLLMFVGLALPGALAHRGLYLPAEEIERLFSAPLRRSQLVRYRLCVHLLRSVPFLIILTLVFAPRLPQPWLATPSIMLSMATITVLGQGVAIALGSAEGRWSRWAARLPVAPLRFLVGLAFWLLFMGLFFADELTELVPGVGNGGLSQRVEALAATPLFRILSWPLQPWAAAITAADGGAFLLPFGASVFLFGALAWTVVHVPVDFRALSLATSADVAKRLAKLRSGRGMISGARAQGAGWHVPWLFGRGPAGAVSWLQLCSIVRKSRGTLMFYAFVVGVLTLSSVVLSGGDGLDGPFGPATIESTSLLAVLGTLYLSMGLRFDFRSELDLMDVIKAWPLPSWRIFLAMILPEVILVSFLVVGALSLRGAIVGIFPPGFAWLALGLPFLTFIWTALDNAIFLLAPVRFTPDQGSSMHFAGRSIVLVLVRMASISGLLFALGGTFVVVHEWQNLYAALVATLLVALGAGAGLLAFGGWTFARFDVSRHLPRGS